MHTFLADVPLHDVWVFHLRGGGKGRTMRDFQELWSDKHLDEINPIVKTLFSLRGKLGDVFGWDEPKHRIDTVSYIHRLTDVERNQSFRKPGSKTVGPFQLVYEFENEMLGETINATVHAFSLMAMEPKADGYIVYWAIYVKNEKEIESNETICNFLRYSKPHHVGRAGLAQGE